MACIHRLESENVPEESTVRLGVFAIDNDVRAKNHQPLPSLLGKAHVWLTQVSLLGRKMPQLARLWVEPGIPEIKRRVLARKRAPELRLGFRSYAPSTGALIEGDRASCFSSFVGQVRNL